MSGFKGLFFKEEDSQKVVEVVTKTAFEQKTVISNPIPKTPANSESLLKTNSTFGTAKETITPVSNNTYKNEFLEYLNKVFVERNFPGPDYQEFKKALTDPEIVNLPIDTKTKYTTTFIGFKMQGLTKTKLIETANGYISIVNEKMAGFNAELESVLNSEVGGLKKTTEKLQHDNEEIENQMRVLSERRNKNNEQLLKLNSEINEQVAELSNKKSSFELAVKDFVEIIKKDVEEIRQYLPDTI